MHCAPGARRGAGRTAGRGCSAASQPSHLLPSISASTQSTIPVHGHAMARLAIGGRSGSEEEEATAKPSRAGLIPPRPRWCRTSLPVPHRRGAGLAAAAAGAVEKLPRMSDRLQRGGEKADPRGRCRTPWAGSAAAAAAVAVVVELEDRERRDGAEQNPPRLHRGSAAAFE